MIRTLSAPVFLLFFAIHGEAQVLEPRSVTAGGGFAGVAALPMRMVWTPTSMVGAPTPRSGHTAVWTGSRMIIWGCSNENTGGLYDPATDTWTRTSTVNAPSPRCGHTAVWTGTRMIVWGGGDGGGFRGDGASYDPTNDTWSPLAMKDAPSPRSRHAAVWTGEAMIVWGGYAGGGVDDGGGKFFDTGARYDPEMNAWTSISRNSAPEARAMHAAVWTGSRLIVWGGIDYVGLDSYTPIASGGSYDPVRDEWSSVSTRSAPLPYTDPTAIWTGSRMIVGGCLYDPETDSWDPIKSSAPPYQGTWCAPTTGETGSSTVWTGTRMFIWGGSCTNAGYVYDPRADHWLATSLIGAPSPRNNHTAVFTGNETIIWGGWNVDSPDRLGTGARARFSNGR